MFFLAAWVSFFYTPRFALDAVLFKPVGYKVVEFASLIEEILSGEDTASLLAISFVSSFLSTFVPPLGFTSSFALLNL